MRIGSASATCVAVLGGALLAACADSPGETSCATPSQRLRCDESILDIAPHGGWCARLEHTFLAYDHAFEVGADGLELVDQARLAELRAKAPELATTMATAEVVEFLAVSNQVEPDPNYAPPAELLVVPFGLVHDNFVPTARRFDSRTHVFTVNGRDEMTSFIEAADVDGILTDDPELLAEVMQELEVSP